MPVINNPGGVSHYGGSDIVSVRSADGSIFVIAVLETADKRFGTYVYRTHADGRSEWVPLPETTEGRCGVTIEPDGMYLSWPVNRDKQVTRVKVPGYVTPSFPGGTNFPAPSPIVVSSQDTEARANAQAALKYAQEEASRLYKEIKKLTAEINALKKSSTAQLTEQEIKDRIWQFSADRFYFELSNPNSPVSNLIREIAKGLR